MPACAVRLAPRSAAQLDWLRGEPCAVNESGRCGFDLRRHADRHAGRDLAAARQSDARACWGRRRSWRHVYGPWSAAASSSSCCARSTESLGHQVAHDAQRSAALNLFRSLYAQALFERSRVYPGVITTLRALQEAGLPLCCLTNKERAFAEPLLQAAGLAGFFRFTLCADRSPRTASRARMLLAACSRLGITPAELLYVGDSQIDIAAAGAAGCAVIAVSYGYEPGRRLVLRRTPPAARRPSASNP